MGAYLSNETVVESQREALAVLDSLVDAQPMPFSAIEFWCFDALEALSFALEQSSHPDALEEAEDHVNQVCVRLGMYILSQFYPGDALLRGRCSLKFTPPSSPFPRFLAHSLHLFLTLFFIPLYTPPSYPSPERANVGQRPQSCDHSLCCA